MFALNIEPARRVGVLTVKRVFIRENPGLVQTAKMLLEQNGIACMVRNEFASGGVGELSFIDAWPELWILNDEDAVAAIELLNVFEGAQCARGTWQCQHCGETNDASFELCWNCGCELPVRQ